MFCTKCGKEGFPVGVACLRCGSQLTAIPRVIDPEVKEDVFCQKCGKEADDVKLFCLACGAPFPRPFSFNGDGDIDPEFATDKNIHWIEYFVDDNACDECKKFAGLKFPPADIAKHKIPIPKCRRPVCFCSVVAY